MMETPILSDREKLNKWNDICISQGWADHGELEKWLAIHGFVFTNAGSCVSSSFVNFRASTNDIAEQLIKSGTGEEMATHILEALTGGLIFINSEVEVSFWKAAIERLSVEADLFMPPEIVPKSVRESLKYPTADNQGSV